MGARDAVEEEMGSRLTGAVPPITASPLGPPAAGQAPGGYASSRSKLTAGPIAVNSGEQAASRAPALTFSLSYPGPLGRRTEIIEWQPGRTLNQHLADRPGLKGMWLRHRSIDAGTRRKIRLSHIPTAGQRIILLHGPGSR